jgi:hypothetical protein
MSSTARDALEVFAGSRLVSCPACHATRWRQAGDGEVCTACHPAPEDARPAGADPRPRTGRRPAQPMKRDKTMPTMVDRDEILSAVVRVLRDDPRAAVPLFEQLPGGTQVAMLTSLFAARPTWFVRALLAAIGTLITQHPDEAVAMFVDPTNDGLDDDDCGSAPSDDQH